MTTEVSTLYKFFSKCFYYPDKDLTELFHRDTIEAFVQIFSEKPTNQEKFLDWIDHCESESAMLRDLQVEYTGLFITAVPKVLAPPYASFYLENEIYGRMSGEISGVYHQYGFRISGQMKEPADHLALELEFLSRMVDTHEWEGLEGEFLRKYLLTWLNDFNLRVKEEARLPVYPYLVTVLKLFLTERVEQSTLI